MATTIHLPDHALHTLTGALYTAIDRECAKAMAEEPGYAGLVPTFEKQIADCQAILDGIEEA